MKLRLVALAIFVSAQAGCGSGGGGSVVDSTISQPADTALGEPAVPVGSREHTDSAPTKTDSLPPLKSGGQAAAARQDTASGVVKLLGSAPTAQLTLLPVGGGGNIALTGPSRAALERTNGAHIWVSGTLSSGPGRPLAARSMKVERFVVRAVDGVSATDGVLSADGDALILTASDGKRHRLVTPPSGLRSHVGARVWIAGPIDREPTTFGVIVPKS